MKECVAYEDGRVAVHSDTGGDIYDNPQWQLLEVNFNFDIDRTFYNISHLK